MDGLDQWDWFLLYELVPNIPNSLDVVEGCYDNSSLTADLTLSIGVSDVEDVGKLKCLGYCR